MELNLLWCSKLKNLYVKKSLRDSYLVNFSFSRLSFSQSALCFSWWLVFLVIWCHLVCVFIDMCASCSLFLPRRLAIVFQVLLLVSSPWLILVHSFLYIYICLKRICTRQCDFKANCDILSKKIIDRGYQKAEIYGSISKTFDRNGTEMGKTY